MRACTYVDDHAMERCTECGVSIDLCNCDYEASARARNNTADGEVIKMIYGELRAARASFPETTHMLVALGEEYGELCQAMIDHDRSQAKSTNEVLREAVQVATMAIRVATEGDDNFLYQYPRVEEDLPRGPVGGQYD